MNDKVCPATHERQLASGKMFTLTCVLPLGHAHPRHRLPRHGEWYVNNPPLVYPCITRLIEAVR